MDVLISYFNKKMKINTQKGFSAVELFILVTLIVLIIGIVFNVFAKSGAKSVDTGKIRAVAEIKNALNIYYNDTAGGDGSYPIGNNMDLEKNLVPKYIRSISPMIKYYSENGTNYHLGTVLTSSGNKMLNDDADKALAGDDFEGKSADCNFKLSDVDYCYDIVN